MCIRRAKTIFFETKIFFINPSSLIKEEIIETFILAEYDVYALDTLEEAFSALQHFPSSTMYINVDAYKSAKIIDFLKKIKTLTDSTESKIGILAKRLDPIEKKLFREKNPLKAGELSLDDGLKQTKALIAKELLKSKENSRRKYLRYNCESKKNCNLTILFKDIQVRMKILDISTRGICCIPEERKAPKIVINTYITDVILTLKTVRIKTNIINFRVQDIEGEVKYIMLFTPGFSDNAKERIRSFIHTEKQKDLKKIISPE